MWHSTRIGAAFVMLVVLGASLQAGGSAWKKYLPEGVGAELLARAAREKQAASADRAKAEAALMAGYQQALGKTPDAKPSVELAPLMDLFRNKDKGGEGLHTDLHLTKKLANLNGSEELIGALASKKQTDANLDKAAKELELLAYRIAVIGSLTHDLAPTMKVKNGDPAQWRQISLAMRDASVLLAESAKKKDGDAILAHANQLQETCINCHKAFR